MEEVHFTNLLIVAPQPPGRPQDTVASSAALIAAGLLSVVIFPLLGLSLLRKGPMPSRPSPAMPVLSVEDRALCSGG